MDDGLRARLKWAAIACAVTLPLHLVWIVQGLDLTDEGFNLTQQWLAIHGSPRFSVDLRWLSDVLGGVWLVLVGDLGVLGARLGWALVSAFSAGLTTWVLADYVPLRRAALGGVTVALGPLHYWPMVLDYNTIPGLLLLGSLALFLAGRQPAWRARERQLALAGGVLLGLAIMGRFVLLPAIALAAGPPAVAAWRWRRRPTRDELRGPAAYLAGVALGFLVCLVGLALCGWLDDLTASFLWRAADDHSPHNPRVILKGHAYSLLRATLLGIEWVALVAVLVGGLALTLGDRLRLRGVLALLLALGVLLLKVSFQWRPFAYLLPGVGIALGGGVLFLLARLAPADDERAWRVSELLAVALPAALSTMVGSAQGVTSIRIGLWVLLPAAALSLPDLVRLLPSPDDPRAVRLRGELERLGAVLLIALAAGALVLRAPGPFRDVPNRLYLTEAIDHPKLRGIRTTRGRAASTQALLDALARWVEPGDELLAYSNVPGLYYLTDTHPAISHPWPKGERSVGQLERELEGAFTRGAPIAVRGMADLENRHWGTDAYPWDAEGVPLIVHAIDEALSARGYVTLWENRDFAILGPPDRAR